MQNDPIKEEGQTEVPDEDKVCYTLQSEELLTFSDEDSGKQWRYVWSPEGEESLVLDL